jgi:Uma2 family endonuclease
MVLEIPTSFGDIDDQRFLDLCRVNPSARLEKTDSGGIIIMAPTGGETGRINSNVITEFGIWNKKQSLGYIFDSSTAFKLPNGAIRSPDLAFVKKLRWDSLSLRDRKKFPPLCPDFVIEILSESDSLLYLQEKMEEWMKNGCKLAWLLDFDSGNVNIYKENQNPIILNGLEHILSDKEILPDFELDLLSIL